MSSNAPKLEAALKNRVTQQLTFIKIILEVHAVKQITLLIESFDQRTRKPMTPMIWGNKNPAIADGVNVLSGDG